MAQLSSQQVKKLMLADVLEFDVHEDICAYISTAYPGVIYHTDPAGLMLTKAQAGKLTRLQQQRGWPDLFIAEAVGKYHGCFIELKRPTATVWLKDGTISTVEHIQEQLACLERLQAKGYYCNFAIGLEEARLIVDKYMKGEL